jgi:polyhydroxyalkanoate synthesis repressor PhaR
MAVPPSPWILKKYGNRRLYDTAQSRYITLDEVAARVREGADPRVVDAKSGQDLTQATLTQIIIEGRQASRLLPIPLLLQLVRMGDDTFAEFLGRFLATALEVYLQAKQQARAMSPFNPFAMSPFAATDTLARLFGAASWGGAPPAAAGSPAVSPEAPGVERPEAGGEVATLRRELEELKRMVRRRGKGSGGKPKRR